MAKVTREHLITARQQGKTDSEIAQQCGVSKQAVYQMRKKLFPNGMGGTEEKGDQS